MPPRTETATGILNPLRQETLLINSVAPAETARARVAGGAQQTAVPDPLYKREGAGIRTCSRARSPVLKLRMSRPGVFLQSSAGSGTPLARPGRAAQGDR